MKKSQILQKKRHSSQKGRVYTFHGKVKNRFKFKKQQLSAGAATMDGDVPVESEVPGLGVARALGVILLLHVLAIGAIVFHNHLTRSDHSELGLGSGSLKESEKKQPITNDAESYEQYQVATGDTYERISRSQGTDEDALRKLNNNEILRVGKILNLPTKLPGDDLASVESDGEILPPVEKYDLHLEEPVIPWANTTEQKEESQLVRPVRQFPAVAVVVPEPKKSVVDSKRRYRVRKGDTVWRISKRFGVTPSELQKLNGVSDPRKLRVGMELKIPKKN